MTEDCERHRLMIQAGHDGELDAAHVAELERHLAECPACATHRAELTTLSRRLKAEVPYHAAPPGLRALVEAQLGRKPASPARTGPARMGPVRRHGPGVAMGFALAACLALAILPMRGQDIGAEVVASHIRALQASHLVDVASSDQHTVKPWFDGRLDYAPPLRDLAAQGFPLEGGRLDYVDGRPVSALVYRRARHVINLFIWPAASHRGREPSPRVVNGYNIIRWSEGDMAFWAVSDVNATDLGEFVRLWRASP